MSDRRVSRKPSQPKIRPYIKLWIIQELRQKYPIAADDSEFVEWALLSFLAGVGGSAIATHQDVEQVDPALLKSEPRDRAEDEEVDWASETTD